MNVEAKTMVHLLQSDERGGQNNGPPLPIDSLGNSSSRNFSTFREILQRGPCKNTNELLQLDRLSLNIFLPIFSIK